MPAAGGVEFRREYRRRELQRKLQHVAKLKVEPLPVLMPVQSGSRNQPSNTAQQRQSPAPAATPVCSGRRSARESQSNGGDLEIGIAVMRKAELHLRVAGAYCVRDSENKAHG